LTRASAPLTRNDRRAEPDTPSGQQPSRPNTGITPKSTGVPVFIAASDSSYVLLSGSAEYLLDRAVSPTDVGQGMSYPEAIAKLLDAAGEERESRSGHIQRSPWLDVGYPLHNLLEALSDGGLQPLAFMARVTHVSLSERDNPRERYVVGTPLFVALAVPE
jgi:hypothetical protein